VALDEDDAKLLGDPVGVARLGGVEPRGGELEVLAEFAEFAEVDTEDVVGVGGVGVAAGGGGERSMEARPQVPPAGGAEAVNVGIGGGGDVAIDPLRTTAGESSEGAAFFVGGRRPFAGFARDFVGWNMRKKETKSYMN
jgi:hypothetical protein